MLALPPTGFRPTPFKPHPGFANRHVQTILATLLPRRFPGAWRWEQVGTPREFDLADGDRLSGVLHVHPGDPARERPLVIILHGLEGSIDAHYMRGMGVKAHALGYHALRLNFRNCGDTEHLGRRLYNGLMADDVRRVIEVMTAEGFRRLIVIGVSLGAAITLGLLADLGEQAPAELLGAVAISPPLELADASVALGEGFNRLYDRYFLRKLQRKLRRKAAAFPGEAAIAEWHRRARAARNLREFDEAITAPEAGLADAAEYYRRGSVAPRLARIRRPVLILHAQDDPFIPFAMYQRHAAALAANPCLTTLYPAHGGHVGFLERSSAAHPEPWMDAYWAENQALMFARTLEQMAAQPPVGTEPAP